MSTNIRRRFGQATCAALLALVAGAAWAVSVSTNYLPETDFSGHRNYRWVLVEGAPAVDQITDQQIKQAVDKQLAAKGWTRTEGDDADTYVAYQIAVERRQQLNAYGTGGGYRYGWGWGGGMTTVTTSTIDVGTLTLDFYAPRDKALIWRGSASDSLRKKSSPEKRQKRIDKAMTKLLKDFPPK
jgi:hypothetical protein